MRFGKSLLSLGVGLPLWMLSAALAPAQDGVLHLKNGGTVEARIVDYRDDVLSFKTEGSTFSAQMPYEQIEYAELPWPDDFTSAMQYFEFGRFAEAAPMFEKIAARRDRTTAYPVTGNFASLAQRRLLDCHRRLADGKAVAETLATLEVEKLPPDEREILPAFQAWAAAGSADWDDVLRIANAAADEEDFSDASEQGIEMAYLRGLALKAVDDTREAILSFATAYTLNAATDSRISRAALREAAALVEQDEERFAEFQAQIHLYASLFGKGDLWGDASPAARNALGDEVEVGEAALGQTGRTATDDGFIGETLGVRAVEQITADHMRKVGLGRRAAGAKKKVE